jgi:hypothetical protein
MTTLTLFMIVKNESTIIKRCLDSIIEYIDYIVITDTGSTDNTIDIINQYLLEKSIKGFVYQDKWVNFGYNRTKSLRNAQEWLDEQSIEKSTNYFITIDADMVIQFKNFKKSDLALCDSWDIYQYNESIRYYNKRIFKSNLQFKSIGVTHEYWGCDNDHKKGKIETIIIEDRGDGGCKSDKFQRDINLLLKGIEEEPNNHRYFFYLAQSYGDIGDIDNSIKWYKKRIEAGGWAEELFISYKKIGELYMFKNDQANAIYYWTLGYDLLPERSETLYKICNYYRNKGKNNASFLYLKKGIKIPYPRHLSLFLEYPVYDYKFIEELSIIGYYTNHKKEGLLACQYLLLNTTDKITDHLRQSTRSNHFFYMNSIHSLSSSHKKLNLETRNPYISSSACLYKNGNNSIKGIVRAVNYSISDYFKYTIRDPNHKVSTINYWMECDDQYHIQSFYEIETIEYNKKRYNSHITGLEDIRICKVGESIYGLAVDFEHCKNNIPSILLIHLEKNKQDKYMITKRYPIVYHDHLIQKNWTLFCNQSKLYTIYSHHPLTILEIDPTNGNYNIVKEKYSRYNLKDIRGSSNPIKIGDDWLILVHEVIEKNTRKYYHRFMKYSNEWELLELSEPFYFKNFFVEFSLSIINNNIDNIDIIDIIYSTRDNTTEIMKIDYSKMPWLPKDIKNFLIESL